MKKLNAYKQAQPRSDHSHLASRKKTPAAHKSCFIHLRKNRELNAAVSGTYVCVCIKQSVTTEMAVSHTCNIPISVFVYISRPESKWGEGKESLFAQNISLLNEHREG